MKKSKKYLTPTQTLPPDPR